MLYLTGTTQETLVILKPETLQQKKVGIVMGYVQGSGLAISAMGKFITSHELIQELYKEHVGKPFLSNVLGQMVNREIIALILKGPNAVQVWRDTQGHYDEALRLPGTVRGDLMKSGTPFHLNFTHGSKLVKDARREIKLLRPYLSF